MELNKVFTKCLDVTPLPTSLDNRRTTKGKVTVRKSISGQGFIKRVLAEATDKRLKTNKGLFEWIVMPLDMQSNGHSHDAH